MATGLCAITACSSAEEEQSVETQAEESVDLEKAPDASWEEVAGIPAPVDSTDGPENSTPVPHGYTHTPQGAVQAAILGQVWMATADDETWPEVSSIMTAPGQGRDQWAQGRSLITVSGEVDNPPQFKGFYISDYKQRAGSAGHGIPRRRANRLSSTADLARRLEISPANTRYRTRFRRNRKPRRLYTV